MRIHTRVQSLKQHFSFNLQSEFILQVSLIKHPGKPTDLGHSFGTISTVVFTIKTLLGSLPFTSSIFENDTGDGAVNSVITGASSFFIP